MRKKEKNFQYIFEGIYGVTNYTFNNLENNMNYEIRIATYIGPLNYFPLF